MAQKLVTPPVDHEALALAARQHGVVTRTQLTAIGLDDRAIGRRVQRGRLHRVHRGVYAVGHDRLTTKGRFLAAVFSCGDGAVLSYLSAAVLDEAAYLRLDVDGLRPLPGRRGAGVLDRVLAEHHAGSTWTRSDLEERMLGLCRRADLPQPEVNQKVEGHEADFVWRDARLIVETDGWDSHGTRRAVERDRMRDAERTASGRRVVRLTKRRLAGEPGAVATQLRRLLS